MDGDGKVTFRIEGFTPATLPLERLAEYLAQIAIMLGEPNSVHFVKLKKGSVVPVINVDREAVPRVRARAASIRIGTAPSDAKKAYNTINNYLREDNSVGLFKLTEPQSSSSEIIRFPGRNTTADRPILLKQNGSLDGELEKVGGAGKFVPVILRSEGAAITNCFAHRSVAEELGAHLFKPVRLFGVGNWSRTQDGIWTLSRFKINTFKKLNNQPLTEVIQRIRSIEGGEWDTNSLSEIDTFRSDSGVI